MKTVRNISGWVICFVMIAVSTASADGAGAGGEALRLDLSGSWEIRLGDDMAWILPVNGDEGDWEPFKLPGNLAGYARQKTGKVNGRAWVRKTFHVPAHWAGRKLGLVLGRISHTDEAYLNGVFIGGEGDMDSLNQALWYRPRYYEVPDGLIRAGQDNVISARIQFHTVGDFSGAITLLDHGTWLKGKQREEFLRIVACFIIVAMGIPFMVIFFLFYLQRPASKEYFYYSLQVLCGLAIVLDLAFLWDLTNGIALRFRLVSCSWLGWVVVHGLFLHAFFHLRREKITWALIALVVVMFPVILFTGDAWIRNTAMAVVILSLVIGLYLFHCYGLAIMRKQPAALLYGILGMTVLLTGAHDGIIQMSRLFFFTPHVLGYRFDYMLFPFGLATLYTGTALVLAYRFVELRAVNEDLKSNLETKVAQRTRSLILITEELERQNVRLKDMALRDSLTGLYNHASFCDRLDEIFISARETRTPLAVAMIDLDDFKGLNDTYGHQAGDQVLLSVSSILKNSLREYDYLEKYHHDQDGENRHYDLAGRYGGDEFMMVLPGCDETTALMVSERICDLIHAIRIDAYPDLSVSASFGLAVLKPNTPCPDSDKLTSLADEALYDSKSLGKNRVVCKIYHRPFA